MILSLLTGYHLLWFDLFLQIPKIRQHWRRIFQRGTKLKSFHNSKTKHLFKDIKLSDTFSFTAAGI